MAKAKRSTSKAAPRRAKADKNTTLLVESRRLCGECGEPESSHGPQSDKGHTFTVFDFGIGDSKPGAHDDQEN